MPELKMPISRIGNLVILAGLFMGCMLVWNHIPSAEHWTAIPAYGAIALFVYQLLWMVNKRIPYYDFRLWFVLLQYLFIFGRIILHQFHWDADIFWNLMEYYSVKAMFRASVYALVYTQAIFTGLFWCDGNPHRLKTHSPKQEVSGQCMLFVGIVMLIISLPFKVMNDLITIRAQTASGSYVAVAVDNGMTYAFGMLMPVAVLYLICSAHLRRRTVNIIMLVMILYMGFVMVMSGDRRYAITALIAVVLCYLQKYKIKLRVGQAILIFLVVQLVLLILATIRMTRMTVASLGDFWNLFVSSIQTSNIFYETFSEFGLTFFIYAASVEFFPAVFPFKLGTTYLLGPLTAIPMSGVLFPGLQTGISGHMDCKSITDQPLGAALGEELFCNFGLAAPLFAVLIGVLIAVIMRSKKGDACSMARYYGLFYIMLNLVRASTTEILRIAVYAVLIPWLLIRFYQYINYK